MGVDIQELQDYIPIELRYLLLLDRSYSLLSVFLAGTDVRRANPNQSSFLCLITTYKHNVSTINGKGITVKAEGGRKLEFLAEGFKFVTICRLTQTYPISKEYTLNIEVFAYF
jgi:hypothetical protein